MSALISVDYTTAQFLSFVAQGAGRADPESIIFFEPTTDNEYKISTNTGASYRHVFVNTNGTVHTADGSTAGDTTPSCAIRAVPLQQAVKLVDEDNVLSIQLDDDTVKLSTGGVSFTLDNLYDDVMKVVHSHTTEQHVTVDGSVFISSVNRIKSIGESGGDIAFTLSQDDGTLSVSAGSDDIRGREIIGPVAVTEDYTITLPKAHIKALKNDLVKKAGVEDVTIKTGLGVSEFVLKCDPIVPTSTVSCHYVCPTTVGQSQLSDDNPCDSDPSALFTTDKKDVTGALSSVSSVVRQNKEVTVTATASNSQVTITAHDGDGTAKMVVFNADVDNDGEFTITPALLSASLAGVSKGQVEFGTADYKSHTYMMITPLFDESEEEDTNNPDMVIAAKTSETK